MILHLGSPAPEVHHFSPLITYSSPSSTAVAAMLVASDEATPGSVMPKADLISPFNKGVSHSSFWVSLPYLTKTSMFPVSGAEQLKTSDAIPDRPICSARCEYSKFVNPAPSSLSGRKRFHSPAFFAFSFISSMIGGTHHLPPSSTCCS